jgi:hypothetical protein
MAAAATMDRTASCAIAVDNTSAQMASQFKNLQGNFEQLQKAYENAFSAPAAPGSTVSRSVAWHDSLSRKTAFTFLY